MAIDNQPVGTRENAAERRVKALELRKRGASYRTIGDELGVSGKTAWEDVQQSLSELAELEHDTAEEYRAMEEARLDDLALEAWRILRTPSASLSTKLAAIDQLRRISESRRKLRGLDAPTKTALTNPDGTPYEAQQQLIGVVLNLLAPYPDLRLALAAQLTTEETDAADDVQG